MKSLKDFSLEDLKKLYLSYNFSPCTNQSAMFMYGDSMYCDSIGNEYSDVNYSDALYTEFGDDDIGGPHYSDYGYSDWYSDYNTPDDYFDYSDYYQDSSYYDSTPANMSYQQTQYEPEDDGDYSFASKFWFAAINIGLLTLPILGIIFAALFKEMAKSLIFDSLLLFSPWIISVIAVFPVYKVWKEYYGDKEKGKNPLLSFRFIASLVLLVFSVAYLVIGLIDYSNDPNFHSFGNEWVVVLLGFLYWFILASIGIVVRLVRFNKYKLSGEKRINSFDDVLNADAGYKISIPVNGKKKDFVVLARFSYLNKRFLVVRRGKTYICFEINETKKKIIVVKTDNPSGKQIYDELVKAAKDL